MREDTKPRLHLHAGLCMKLVRGCSCRGQCRVWRSRRSGGGGEQFGPQKNEGLSGGTRVACVNKKRRAVRALVGVLEHVGRPETRALRWQCLGTVYTMQIVPRTRCPCKRPSWLWSGALTRHRTYADGFRTHTLRENMHTSERSTTR